MDDKESNKGVEFRKRVKEKEEGEGEREEERQNNVDVARELDKKRG